MRNVVVAASIAVGLAAGTAYGLTEWWTPKNAKCPVFDSEDSCKSFCRSNPDRCGGQVECTFRTGDQHEKPMC